MNSYDYRVKFAGLLEEYRSALISDSFCSLDDRESGARIRKAREAVLEFVRQNRLKFKHRYTLADYFPRDAYRVIMQKEEGERDMIDVIHRRLEKEAGALRDEVCEIVESDKDGWNWRTEESRFEELCKAYRAIIVEHWYSKEMRDKKLRTVKRQLRDIYVHPQTSLEAFKDIRLLEIIARPVDTDESSDALDVTLSREAFALLDSLRSSLKRERKQRNK